LIAKNECAIEKTNIEMHDNYYRTEKVIRPWDICPAVELECKRAAVRSGAGNK